MRLPQVRSAGELAALVDEIGFLPFFANALKGFSLEECVDRGQWFVDGIDGPWEWKGPAIRQSGCAYGKFFHGKAGYVSRAWYADFANMRRDGMDFDELYGAGEASREEKLAYDALRSGGAMLSRDLKWRSGCARKGFDATVARLQMRAYVITVDFEYARDRFGRPYGWGLARLDTPEHAFGASFSEETTCRSPEASRDKVLTQLARICPDAEPRRLERFADG